MGAGIPQVITETKASGAQVIDGSLKFDDGFKTYLSRTPSASNQKTYTHSVWLKRNNDATGRQIWFAAIPTASNYVQYSFNSNVITLYFRYDSGTAYSYTTTAVFRDTNAWYNVVIAVDSTQATASDRLKIYVNGVNYSYSGTVFGQNTDTTVNSAVQHAISSYQPYSDGAYFDGSMLQTYFVDGQALDASYFGYTDGLTNTWRPKKYKFLKNPNNGTTWSSMCSGTVLSGYPYTRAFDSNTSTACYPANGNTITFTPTGGIKNSGNILVTFNNGSASDGGGSADVQINGSSVKSFFQTAITADGGGNGTERVATITGITNITSMSWSRTDSTDFFAVGRIQVDGYVLLNGAVDNSFYLPMDGNSPIGHDKSNPNPVNNGTVWSSGAGANFESANPASNGFNGSADSYTRTDNANVTATVTLPSAVPFTTLQVRGARDSGNGTITVNGVNVSSQYASGSATLQTITLTGVSSPLTSIALTGISGSAQPRFSQIIVDGVILIDNMYGNGWTPVNFGGSVALDNPIVSGARPILNTDGGGRTARVGVFGSEVGAYYDVTVSNPGSGNKYYLDGVLSANPTLTRGATYTFDQSDSSNSGHPLVFGTTAEGNNYSDGVTTNGTPGSAGAYTKITVPHNAPDTLYYHCSVHSGMGSSTSQITDETKADIYAWKNVLALPLVGSANDLSNSVNSGSTTKTATVTNANASSAQSNFYNGSFDFDGSGDYISYGTSSEMDFGSGDCTVECWLYINSHSADKTIVGSWEGNISWQLSYGADSGNDKFAFMMYNGSTTSANSSLLSTNYAGQWVHLAGVRNGNELQIWVNGKKDGTASFSGAHNALNSAIRVGGRSGGNQVNAHIQDVRIYKGVAKYTSDFVVASTSPDILPDTPSGVSGSSKLAKVTEGAVIGDGTTSDYLQVSSSGHTDFSMDGDFTVEWFYYRNSVASAFMWTVGDSGTSTGLELYWGSSGSTLKLYTNGGDSTITGDPMVGWSHYAVVRSGSTITAYYNGISGGTTSNSTTFSGNFTIGGEYYNSGITGGLSGPISNFRYIKGTALYTTDFTPPTRELTDVTNTKLLCCQSNTFVGSAAITPVTGNTGYTGTSQSITLNQANLNAGTVANVVDGSTSTSADIRDAGSFVELIFPQQQNGELQVNVSNGNDVGDDNIRVFIDGVEGTAFDVSSQSWYTIHTGNFTTVKLEQQGSTTGNIFGFRIGTGGDTIISKSVAPVGNAAATNFNPFTTDINAVRGQETGYATWNALDKGSGLVLGDGNLKIVSVTNDFVRSTLSMSSGRWYFEYTQGTGLGMVGLADGNAVNTQYLGQATFGNGYAYYSTGTKYGPSNTGTAYGASYTTGVVIGVAFDADAGVLTFYNNNISQGAAFTGLTAGPYFFAAGVDTMANSFSNFGQKPFKFPPPAGFQPLNAANVRPETVITRPDQYVGVTTYTGNGSVQSINVGLKPDFVWIKNRDTTDSHVLFDTIRGVERTLYSNLTNNDSYNAGSLTSFDSDGFTLGSYANANQNTSGLVAWTWKAGGNKNTFNVDDVGYASASDVNMSVGALNSVSYNQTQTWSSNVSGGSGAYGAAANAFNGNLSNFASPEYSSAMTYTNPSASDTVIDTFEIYGRQYSTSITLELNDTDIKSQLSTTVTWHNITGFSGQTFNKLYWRPTSGNLEVRIYAIRINGKTLVDSGVTPPDAPSIASTGASVGTKQGFSIIKWTGDGTNANGTVPHGLLQAPSFIIVKPLTEARHWLIWHKDFDDDAAMLFDTGTPAGSRFGPNAPTSNVFGVYGGQGNRGTTDFIGYSWHDVPGLQKFGSYTGNGTADNGPFVELGFRPAVILIKRTTTGTGGFNWTINDSGRNKYNPSGTAVFPNLSNQESTNDEYEIDFLSNGFKPRCTTPDSINVSGQTYIYAAWAEAPTFNLFGAQSNAR